MPLYEYECTTCAHRFEVIQKYSDPLVQVCPKCGAAVQKLFSSPAIQFKGSGFYITDYARAKNTDGGGSSASSSESQSDSKGETKSDTKSDTKTEAKSEGTKTESKSDSKPSSPPSTS